MSKQVADIQIHAADSQESLDTDDGLDISVDLIDDNLYLGNLACARDRDTLQRLGVTHLLTIDVVPLPRAVLDTTKLHVEYLKLADVPKEDLITHLPATNEYIKKAISNGGTVLVHCYFGVSRSAAVVIAYIMDKYKLRYDDAFTLVKGKRRFVAPNVGFVAQLKLFGHMGCEINKEDPRFKQFRLRLAGQKLKEVKILPQSFLELVKEDPGLARERPSPLVYRCASCRRVLATQGNLLPHREKGERDKRRGREKGRTSEASSKDNGEILIEKLQTLASEMSVRGGAGSRDSSVDRDHGGSEEVLDGYSEQNMVDACIVPAAVTGACRRVWFVEPMRWMRGVTHASSGKLHCPKCQAKIGSFNWIMGCRCPCGQKVAPAFYLVPSKVEWANIVQNVQTTV
ncbi:dual specificity protein phosphatase MPK-4 [Plutella xylostella]|uniref:dual specificity protein phosphatase MPK-4 n=1 Tax=Plutella xylostella TaxID=51655 RepID=UPI0020330E6F|nr:dual specificity protein phosphatase MPK-4 [Plutella xylostella]